MDLHELAKRIQRLEDIEAIKQLKATYCAICDDNHNPDRITTIFADDGEWEGRGIGHAKGHAAIRELFVGFQQAISFSQHMVMNPVIEADGDRATATWYFFGPFTMRDGNRALWQAARYNDDYVKVNGVWKIQHLRVKGPRMSADCDRVGGGETLMARSEHHPNGLIHYNPQLSYHGYTLFTGDLDKAWLIDMQGRFVHRWRCSLGITNAELLPNGHLMALAMPSENVAGQRGLNGQAAACYELDWDGNIVWRYDDPWIHHDYQRLANGNTLIVKWVPLSKSLVRKVKGGYNDAEDDPNLMLGDVVLEVTPTGEIVKEWKSWEHFDPATEIICPLDHRMEWSHCNSLSITPTGDWLLSFRRLSMVGEVSAKSGKFKWKWTGTTGHQHDAKYSSRDTITIFDNGVHRRSIDFSRVIEINAKTREIVWEYADDPPFSFYTFMGGSVDRLPNDNMLICESAKGQLFEVTRGKKVVWEYINPMFINNPRLGGRMNIVFRAHRYDVDHPALAGRDLDPERYANLNRLYGAA